MLKSFLAISKFSTVCTFAIALSLSVASLASADSEAQTRIKNGRYWLGHTGQALEVDGTRYRYDSEGGAQPWKPISDLESLNNGVIFDGKTYWCLSSLHPKNQVLICTPNGWKLPKSQTSSSQPKLTPSRSYIGLIYQDLPTGLTSGGGAMITNDHGIRVVNHQFNRSVMLWLGKTIHYDQDGNPIHQLMDSLWLPKLSKSQILAYRFCQLNGKSDSDIIAIVKPTDDEYYTQVYQAWRANTQTSKLESIPTAGISCSNLGAGT